MEMRWQAGVPERVREKKSSTNEKNSGGRVSGGDLSGTLGTAGAYMQTHPAHLELGSTHPALKGRTLW